MTTDKARLVLAYNDTTGLWKVSTFRESSLYELGRAAIELAHHIFNELSEDMDVRFQ